MAKIGGTSMIVVGGGTGDLVFSYTPTTLTVGTAAYPVSRMVFRSATATIGMGASPGSTAAFNVDAASYSGIVAVFTNGSAASRITQATNLLRIGPTSNHALYLASNSTDQWSIDGSTASTATLTALQFTARIVGGSTNGLAIRNSGNTRDNFSVNDAGTIASMTDGTATLQLRTQTASGERTVGAAFSGTAGVWLGTNSSTAAILTGITYWDGSGWRSAAEVANVASGFGTLALMKSGGNVVVGGTAAGATASGTLAFASAATEPTATVDLVHVYGFDRSAGNRAFSVYQEAAVQAVGGAVDTEIPVRWNGVNYMLHARAA